MTPETRRRIRRLTLANFRLFGGGGRMRVLKRMATGGCPDGGAGPFKFLMERGLVRADGSVGPAGMAVVISQRLGVRVLAVLVLAKAYRYVAEAGPAAVLPLPSLTCHFEGFAARRTILNCISELRSAGLVERTGRGRVRASAATCSKHGIAGPLLKISGWIDIVNSEIDSLTAADPEVAAVRRTNAEALMRGA